MACRGLTLFVCIAVVTCAGCGGEAQRLESRGSGALDLRAVDEDGRLDIPELRQQLQAFADRYIALMKEAGDQILRDEAEPPRAEARLLIRELQYYPTVSVVTLAAGPDPRVGTLDLMVVTRLQHQTLRQPWVNEVLAESHAQRLLSAAVELEQDMWAIGGLYLQDAQLEQLREIVDSWVTAHPERRYMAHVRLTDIAREGQVEEIGNVISGGFFGPVSEATEAVDDVRELGERAMFLASRMPILLSWQAEVLALELVAVPDVQHALDSADVMAESAQRLSEAAETLPDDLARTAEQYEKLATEVRKTVTETQRLAEQTEKIIGQSHDLLAQGEQTATVLDETIRSADQLAERFKSDDSEQSGRGFDVQEYGDVAEQIEHAAAEVDEVLAGIADVAESEALQSRMDEASAEIGLKLDRAGTQMDDTLSRGFWYGVALIGIALVAGVVYRVVAVKLLPSR